MMIWLSSLVLLGDSESIPQAASTRQQSHHPHMVCTSSSGTMRLRHRHRHWCFVPQHNPPPSHIQHPNTHWHCLLSLRSCRCEDGWGLRRLNTTLQPPPPSSDAECRPMWRWRKVGVCVLEDGPTTTGGSWSVGILPHLRWLEYRGDGREWRAERWWCQTQST